MLFKDLKEGDLFTVDNGTRVYRKETHEGIVFTNCVLLNKVYEDIKHMACGSHADVQVHIKPGTKGEGLSPETLILIDAFGEAAKDWGWMEDQGSRQSRIDASRNNFEASKAALQEHILKLIKEKKA